MTPRTLRQVLLGRLPPPSDDRGSMVMVIMVTLIGVTLGGLLLAMLITQTRSTRFDTSRVHALDAAQSGVDVVLGKIRASLPVDAAGNPVAPDPATGTFYGDPTKLPCGPISSASANGTGSATYSVSIAYFTGDSSAGTAGTVWPCPTKGSNSRGPSYAVITSTGKDGSAVNGASNGRTLTSTYVFQTNTATMLPGGQLKLYPSGTLSYCLDAQSPTPAVGAAVVLGTCSSTKPIAAQQLFAYRSDLSIQLLSSVTAANSNGLCLDTNPTVHNLNVAIVLKQCTNADPSTLASTPWNQQWAFDVYGHLVGWTSDKSGVDGFCMSAAQQVSGQAVLLGQCSSSAYDPTQTFQPSPSTGSGMAGAATNQIVNYQSLARCLDVAGEDPNAGYLILYPCKQNSNPANTYWNQKWTPALGPPSATALPQQGTLSTNNGTSYCLQSPPATGGYATLSTSCTSNISYTWTWYQTRYLASDGTTRALAYAQMYTIVDSSGRCLSAGSGNDQYNNQYAKVVVATCDGDADQKWNADPRVLASGPITTMEN